IPPMVFGANVFGWTVDQPTAIRLLDRIVDGGLIATDTVGVYSRWVPGNKGGESETMIGNWLKGSPQRRSQVVLITKVGMAPGADGKGLSGQGRRVRAERGFRKYHHGGGRRIAAPVADRSHRPLPEPPAGREHADRGNV